MTTNLITIKQFTKEELLNSIKELMNKYLKIDFIERSISFERIIKFIKKLKDTSLFIVEYPYIDKYFRDTYYMYFSSKFKDISRDCIRIHIFDTKILDRYEESKKKYCGYFIIRPLQIQPLGRSFVSPKAFLNGSFVCIMTTEEATVCGRELTIQGFPHVVQDSEAQVCAESALWSLMEYYGLKYREYKTVLPSNIVNNIAHFSVQRTLPSNGLNYHVISACLLENDYKPRIYDYNENSPKSVSILNTYIESGIPVILAIGKKDSNAGHAILAIGHETSFPLDKSEKKITNVMSFKRKLVAIDDNREPYCLIDVDNPTPYEPLENYKIQHFIVPLPKHVYLEAQRVLEFLDEFADKTGGDLDNINNHLLSRTYLTSANSFKSFIRKNDIRTETIQTHLTQLSMPHFIWVCELYKYSEYPRGDNDGVCRGLIIFDATGHFRGDRNDFNTILVRLRYNETSFSMKPFRHNLAGGA